MSAVRRAASRARSGAPPAISVTDLMTNGKIAHANLSREEKRKLLLSSLEDHRHLLRSAIKAMAEGDLRQALPIAVSIRTLVHETGRTKPLLKSLKPNYLDLSIMDLPTQPIHGVHPGGVRSITFNLPISVTFSIEEPRIRLNPDIDPKNEFRPVPLGTWWNKTFMNLPAVGAYSRRQLVLDLADKEAVHSDVDISKQYHQLLGSQFLRFGFGDGEVATINISRLLTGKTGIQMLSFLETHFAPLL